MAAKCGAAKRKGGGCNPKQDEHQGWGGGEGWARSLLAEGGNKNWDEGGERMD